MYFFKRRGCNEIVLKTLFFLSNIIYYWFMLKLNWLQLVGLKQFVFIAIALVISDASSKEVLNLASLYWPPYSGQELNQQGIAVERLKTLLVTKNIELKVHFYPWLRAQQMANTQKFDGYFPAWPEEVKKGFISSPPIMSSQLGIVTHLSKKFKFTSYKEFFKKYRVGIVSTYKYPKYFQDLFKQYPQQIVKVRDENSLIKMLQKGRFEAIITDPEVFNHLAKKHQVYDFSMIEKSLVKLTLVVAFKDNDKNRKMLVQLGGH